MSGECFNYLHLKIGEAISRIEEELRLCEAIRPPLITKYGVAIYEISEDRKSRWWCNGYHFNNFNEADEYFSNCVCYKIIERNTLSDGNQQLIMRGHNGSLYDVYSFAYQEYEADADGNVPFFPDYNKETVNELRKGLCVLKKAEVYVKHIDYLIDNCTSCDGFLNDLKNDLECFNENM